MRQDEVRRKILARRTRFVVAALASAGIAAGASGCCDALGQPCLKIDEPMPDGSAQEPRVCLKIAPDTPKVEEVDDEPKVCLAPPMPSSKPPTPG